MFEAMITALLLATTGECLEAYKYPAGDYSDINYIVVDDCAIPDIDVTRHEDPRMTEIVVGWRGDVPIVEATERRSP